MCMNPIRQICSSSQSPTSRAGEEAGLTGSEVELEEGKLLFWRFPFTCPTEVDFRSLDEDGGVRKRRRGQSEEGRARDCQEKAREDGERERGEMVQALESRVHVREEEGEVELVVCSESTARLAGGRE
jgi:hypothetical protein